MAFQGWGKESFPLSFYHHDIFTWLPPSRDALAKRGRFTTETAPYYQFRFEFGNGEDKPAEAFYWQHDDEIPGGERFVRE